MCRGVSVCVEEHQRLLALAKEVALRSLQGTKSQNVWDVQMDMFVLR